MEFMGFKACMEFIIGYGILITAFVSDRHVSIAAYMKKSLMKITHYFDIWHLKKSKHNCHDNFLTALMTLQWITVCFVMDNMIFLLEYSLVFNIESHTQLAIHLLDTGNQW